MKQERISVALPAELLEAIENKAKADGVTRQQLLVALLDLGLNRSTYPDRGNVIGVLTSIGLLRRIEGKDSTWARDQLREALWQHLLALVSSKT